MINRLARRCYIPLWLAISFLFSGIVCAQTNQVIQGNIVKEVALSKSATGYNLVIKGMLYSEQLRNVSIMEQPDGKRFTIKIPNGMTDPEKIKTPFIAFGPADPLENIRIVENTSEGMDGKALFQLELLVQARIKLKPVVQSVGSGSRLVIALTPEKTVIKKDTETERKAAHEAYEKKKQEIQKREALAQKRDAELKQQQSVQKSRKEVQQIIRHYRKPSLVQISILNASGYAKRAYKLSVYLGKVRKKQIEEKLGIKLDVVNIANALTDDYPQSTIYYRDNYLKAALYLANVIPGEQKVVPLKNQKERIGVDLEIFLGKDYK